MANRKNWLGILVIALVFGMMLVGCDDDSTGGGSGGGGGSTDPALNGTWVQAFWDFQYSISGNTLTLTSYYDDDEDYYTSVKTLTKTSSGGGTDPLNGTWARYYDGNVVETFTFNNNGSLSWAERNYGNIPLAESGVTRTGTYTTSGNTLWLGLQKATQVETYQYSINGISLTLTRNYGDGDYGYTYTKTSSSGGTDPLNGTWTHTDGSGSVTYKFNNGILETSWSDLFGGDIHTGTMTGTYTTSGNNITMTTTSSLGVSYTFNNGRFSFSFAEYTITTGTYTTSGNKIITYGEETQYSINGNILTLYETDPETGEIETMTFIKK
jgi:hypothetical protein